MSKHMGYYDLSTVVYGKFTTYQPSTGAPFTLAGTPAISVYKDNSVTQSTAGVAITADFDSVTGLNHVAIDTSADGTFYSAGSFFDVVITTGTVDGVSVVGSVVFSFTIRKNSCLKPTTAGRTLVVDASGLADANTVKLGPTGAGTAQTARDIGASVLLSDGTGTGQIDLDTGKVALTTAEHSLLVDEVWNEALSGHLGAGSAGEALDAAGSAGDPMATAVPGAYIAGQAGFFIGTYLEAASTDVTAKTDNLPAAPAAVGDIPTAIQNADALLGRDFGLVTGAAARSLLQAARFLRNKVTVVGSTLTIFEEDGTTPAWTATIATDSGAQPIISVAP